MHEEHIAMPHKTAATVAHTIGIGTGKNTLHLIGLDDRESTRNVADEIGNRPRADFWTFEGIGAADANSGTRGRLSIPNGGGMAPAYSQGNGSNGTIKGQFGGGLGP
jgi:hypothetical protein